ncbi:hypothetical protein B0H13DRAFT_1877154 [Mycena leptocephala]|nr:hypothetical protein B0H13DRAFT_1877154 [Mycena leptocephala]
MLRDRTNSAQQSKLEVFRIEWRIDSEVADEYAEQALAPGCLARTELERMVAGGLDFFAVENTVTGVRTMWPPNAIPVHLSPGPVYAGSYSVEGTLKSSVRHNVPHLSQNFRHDLARKVSPRSATCDLVQAAASHRVVMGVSATAERPRPNRPNLLVDETPLT